MQLSDLAKEKAGTDAIINHIDLSDTLKERLYALGMIDGTRIRYLASGPYGELMAYEVRQTVIALRRSDCSKIEVQV